MKYLKVSTAFAKSIEVLSDAEKGRLFSAMLRYAETGEEPTLNGSERVVWPVAKGNIDKQADSFAKRSLANKKNVAVRWDTNKYESIPMDTNRINSYEMVSNGIDSYSQEKGEERERDIPPTPPIEKDKESPKRNTNNRVFIPPTIEDVREYCLQQGYKIDTERFVDYYTSNGWMVGRNKMKDWKAAVRTWVRSSKGGEKKTNNIFLQIMEDEYGQIPNNIGTFGS